MVCVCRPCANISTLSPDHRDHSHQEEYLFLLQHLSGLVDKPLSMESPGYGHGALWEANGSHFPLLGLSFSIYKTGMVISFASESCLES